MKYKKMWEFRPHQVMGSSPAATRHLTMGEKTTKIRQVFRFWFIEELRISEKVKYHNKRTVSALHMLGPHVPGQNILGLARPATVRTFEQGRRWRRQRKRRRGNFRSGNWSIHCWNRCVPAKKFVYAFGSIWISKQYQWISNLPSVELDLVAA